MPASFLTDPGVAGPTQSIIALAEGNWSRIGIRTAVTVLEGITESLALLLLGNLALGTVAGGYSTSVPGLAGLGPTATSLLCVLVLVLARLCLGLVSARLSARIASSISLRCRIQMLSSFSEASYITRERTDFGGLVQTVSLWPFAIGTSVGTLLGYSSNAVITLSMLIFAFARDPLVSVFVIFLTILMLALFVPMRRRIRLLSTSLLARQQETSRSISTFSYLSAEAEAFGVLNALRESSVSTFTNESEAWRRANFAKSSVAPVYVAMSLGAITLGLGLLSLLSVETVTSVGPTLLIVLRSLSYGQGLQQASATLASFMPMLQQVATALDAFERHRRLSGPLSASPFRSLKFDGVAFSYQNERESGLKNINLEIFRGDRIGIIGPSGSGKSTLVKAILGLIEPSEGRVLLNENEASLISSSSRAEIFAYVPQFARLMSGSLEENTLFLRPSRKGRTAEESLMASGLLPDDLAFPKGPATHVDPDSSQLSGGQVQRLALARALLGDPEVVVLDEPSSSIDNASEARIRKVLEEIAGDVTLIIVSHRAELLRLCDKIAVLDHGQITHLGSIAEVSQESDFARGMFK